MRLHEKDSHKETEKEAIADFKKWSSDCFEGEETYLTLNTKTGNYMNCAQAESLEENEIVVCRLKRLRSKSIMKLGIEGFEGNDYSLEISLLEYGLAWKENKNGEYLFYYGINLLGEGYTDFDYAYLNPEQFESGFDWIDLDQVLDYVGMNVQEWKVSSFTQRVTDLVSFYGNENVFGSCYNEPFNISAK